MNTASKQRPGRSQGPGAGSSAATVRTSSAAGWQRRLFRNSYTRDGRRFLLDGWCVKIQHQGRRRTFSLKTKNKQDAAAEAWAIHEAIVSRGWDAFERERAPRAGAQEFETQRDDEFWRDRLFVRRYRFPACSQAENDLSVRIEHEGTGYWFPLQTGDPTAAIESARNIFRVVVEQGWSVACRLFSRELIIGFEWCSNPILWTYTTVHTLVTGGSDSLTPGAGLDARRVLVVESDPGVRRVLAWCVDRQAGFRGIPCESAETFAHAFAAQRPNLVLVNRNLAERVGIETPGRISTLARSVPALTYSVAVDGDQLFVSTPGGADGYLLKRVKPTSIFEPIASAAGAAALAIGDMDRGVKNYFKDSLLPRPKEATGAMATLTSREFEVLGLLSKGCVDKEIAQALGISPWTVHGHVKKIFERLGVRTRTEAVVRYLEK